MRRRGRRHRELVPGDRLAVPPEDEPRAQGGRPAPQHPQAAGLQLRWRCSGRSLGVQGGHREGRSDPSGHQQRTRDEGARARDACRPDLPRPKEPPGPPARLDVGRDDREVQGQAALRQGVCEEEVAPRAPWPPWPGGYGAREAHREVTG